MSLPQWLLASANSSCTVLSKIQSRIIFRILAVIISIRLQSKLLNISITNLGKPKPHVTVIKNIPITKKGPSKLIANKTMNGSSISFFNRNEFGNVKKSYLHSGIQLISTLLQLRKKRGHVRVIIPISMLKREKRNCLWI